MSDSEPRGGHEPRILTVVPVRGGSKGVPRKNLRPFGGVPLIANAVKIAKASSRVGKVIVSTDDQEMADAAAAAGAEVPFLRPADLAQDMATLIQVIQHALAFFDERGEHFDAVLSLQATVPLLKPETVDAVIEKFLATGCEAVATASEVRHGHPWIAKRIGPEGDTALPFMDLPEGTKTYPRQARPDALFFNGALFLRRRELIEKGDHFGNAVGSAPRFVMMEPEESINIDSIFDLDLANILRES